MFKYSQVDPIPKTQIYSEMYFYIMKNRVATDIYACKECPSQGPDWNQDYNLCGLNIEIETETEILKVKTYTETGV